MFPALYTHFKSLWYNLPANTWSNDQYSECLVTPEISPYNNNNNNSNWDDTTQTYESCKLADGHIFLWTLLQIRLVFWNQVICRRVHCLLFKIKQKKKHFVDSAGLCSQVKEWVKRQLSWSWQESHFKTLIHKFRIVNDTKHGVPCWDNYWTVPIPVYENLWACDSKYGRKKIKEINYDKKYWNHDFIYVLKQEPRAQ